MEARIGDGIYNDVKSVSKIIGVQKSFEQLLQQNIGLNKKV